MNLIVFFKAYIIEKIRELTGVYYQLPSQANKGA